MRAQQNDFLAAVADEGSSYTVKLVFKDEDKNSMTPSSIVWTLTAEDGQVVNSRYKQSLVPAATVYVTMSGDDLQLIDKQTLYETRVLTIEAVYNSTYGSNLPLVKQIFFKVRNVILIAIALSVEVEEMVFTDDYVEDVIA